MMLILSISAFCIELKHSPQSTIQLGKQTEKLVESTQKYLDQKKSKSNTELAKLASKVFTKIDLNQEIFLPIAQQDSSPILKKEKVIEIKISQSQAPCVESNIENIKLLNAYHQHHAPNYSSPIVSVKKDSPGPDKLKARPFTELAMLSRQDSSNYSRPLRNYFNTQYTAKFAVGNKGEEFSFILDTGSGTTLLNDYRCESEGCTKRKRFNSQASPTWKSYGRMVRINYARGGVVIELGRDNFYFGNLLISEQQFGVII